MIYSYLCEGCGHETQDTEFQKIGDVASHRCVLCGSRLRRAVTSVRVGVNGMEAQFQPHFNHTVGAPVTSMADFKDKLAAKARENTEATGIEHTYTMTDPRERDAFGITEETVEMNRAVDRGAIVDPVAQGVASSGGAEDTD